jgi:tetratricopeptide (TPR) repeat protein
MKNLASLFLLLVASNAAAQLVSPQIVSPVDRLGITIRNGNTRIVTAGKVTDYDVGPVLGNILNFHYFPALEEYGNGRYDYAEQNLTFVVNRPYALEPNPRCGEFLSTAHYIRGMIYLYHASGFGSHSLARADFEEAIQWNPNNLVAYLELSRVYSQLGLKDPAVAIIRHLLDLNPDKTIMEQARTELMKLGVEAKP